MYGLPETLPAGATSELQTKLGVWIYDARGAFASNTERAARADLRVWADWCKANCLTIAPAEPYTLAAFVDEQAKTKKPATLRRYLASIAKLHRAAGVADVTKAEPVTLAMRRATREVGARQDQAAGITYQERRAMLATCAPGTSIDLRDAALLELAADTLGRRAELVALNVEDITFDADGSAGALFRRGKTDQAGEGSLRYLAPATVRSLRAWLEAAHVADGPIFRAVTKAGQVADRLQAQDVARVFKRRAVAANLPADLAERISGHSSRVGAAQDMVAAGLELGEIMQAGGWKTPRMVARYAERATVKRGAAAKLAALQGRT
jgi:integrase